MHAFDELKKWFDELFVVVELILFFSVSLFQEDD